MLEARDDGVKERAPIIRHGQMLVFTGFNGTDGECAMKNASGLTRTIVGALALVSAQAEAVVYVCEGYVGNVTTSRGGDLLLESFTGSSWLLLCNLTANANGITADRCKTVYSQLLAAQLAGKKVRLWFDDNLTCSTQAPWNWAGGWYFGPSIAE